MEQDSTASSTGSTKPMLLLACVGVVAVLVAVLPLSAVAAMACSVTAALWWLSSAQQSPPTGENAAVSDSKVCVH
jgi:hypothetical protein